MLVGQAIAGHAVYNDEEVAHAKLLGEQPETLSLWRYVTSSSFGQAVMENWQSEYLQFVVFVMASVWLVQKGSTESKKVDQASWFGQSVTGWSVYNAEQIEHEDTTVNWLGYVTSADFWEATLQNWQSEFLAVGSMVIFSVYLRQRGSSQSKPVGAPHHATAEEG